MTPEERAAAWFERMAQDSEVWATHGLPTETKAARLSAAVADAIRAAVAEERAGWRWVWRTAREAIAPFEAWAEEATQRAGWHCHGCDGEFISTWPQWEKPTDATFPHAKECQYLAACVRAADGARASQ